MKDGLQKLKDNYSTAFQALDGAMANIPSDLSEEFAALNEWKKQSVTFNEEEIEALREAGIEQETLQKLQKGPSSNEQFSSTIKELEGAFNKVKAAKGTYFGNKEKPGAKAALEQ